MSDGATGPKYWGLFSELDDVREQFEPHLNRIDRFDTEPRAGGALYFPTDDEILLARYDYEDYEGDAFVLYEHDGALYEVHGGHCSCAGLEGQWEPEATTWAALAMRPLNKSPFDVALSALIAAHQ